MSGNKTELTSKLEAARSRLTGAVLKEYAGRRGVDLADQKVKASWGPANRV